MNIVEIYNICKLAFPDKEVGIYNATVAIHWCVKSTHVQHGTDRYIWIVNYGNYFKIESNMFRLPSWFKEVVKYKTKIKKKVFIGLRYE